MIISMSFIIFFFFFLSKSNQLPCAMYLTIPDMMNINMPCYVKHVIYVMTCRAVGRKITVETCISFETSVIVHNQTTKRSEYTDNFAKYTPNIPFSRFIRCTQKVLHCDEQKRKMFIYAVNLKFNL